jgi:solute carrier family 35 protein E1
VSASAGGEASTTSERPAWKLPVYIFLWYAFNVIFNIVNKSTLNAFPCPWFIATLQLGKMPIPVHKLDRIV